jgi:hypothetical protein
MFTYMAICGLIHQVVGEVAIPLPPSLLAPYSVATVSSLGRYPWGLGGWYAIDGRRPRQSREVYTSCARVGPREVNDGHG